MIKAVVDRRWYRQEKHWAVPRTDRTIAQVLEAGYLSAVPYTAQAGDIRTVQELLGHSDVKAKMIQPRLFMTIRCENAQTCRERGKRSREGGGVFSVVRWTD